MQRLANITPRSKHVAPVSIKINCNEGLLQSDHDKLGQLITTFEQKRLKSLIREPGKHEEVGFYAKVKGFKAKAKIFNKDNYDILSQALKHNKQLKNVAYAIDLEEADMKQSLKEAISPQTEKLRPVVNVKEKERLKQMINQSKFQMSPLEIKHIKSAIREQEDNNTNRNSINGFLTSRTRNTG